MQEHTKYIRKCPKVRKSAICESSIEYAPKAKPTFYDSFMERT